MMACVAQAKDTELIGYAAEIRYRASLHPPRPSRARGAAVTRQGVDMSSHQSVTVTDLPVANVGRFQTRLASLGPLNFGPRSSRPVDSREGGLPGAWRARRAHMVGRLLQSPRPSGAKGGIVKHPPPHKCMYSAAPSQVIFESSQVA
jgi:hypothetical protein